MKNGLIKGLCSVSRVSFPPSSSSTPTVLRPSKGQYEWFRYNKASFNDLFLRYFANLLHFFSSVSLCSL